MRRPSGITRRGFLGRLGGLSIAGAVAGTRNTPAMAHPAAQRPSGSGIVDVHTHTPTHERAVPASEVQTVSVNRPDKAVRRTYSWQEFIDAMAPVGKACVFGIKRLTPAQGGSIDYGENVNERTAKFARAYPDTLIGFMSVHPDEPNVVEEMERCVHDLGLKGIKLGPNYQNFDPVGPRAFVVYEAAQRMGLPIVFHQGTSPQQFAPLRYAHPLTVDEIAMAFPELRIVMGHMGHPWQTDTVCVIRKHPHVYADTSALVYRPWSTYQAFIVATEWSVLHKMLFATDFPFTTPQETMDGLRAINTIVEGTTLPRVPVAEIEKIINRPNTLELLGIDA